MDIGGPLRCTVQISNEVGVGRLEIEGDAAVESEKGRAGSVDV